MNTRSEWNNNSTTSFSEMFYTKEETIDSVVENYNYRRYYSAEGFSVIIDGITTEQVIIQDYSNPINQTKTDKKMLLPMDTVVHCGSYITYRGETWLVISHVNIVDDAYKSCQIQLCNYTIKFQSLDGTILSYPCITSDKSFSQDETKVITLGSNKKSILCAKDANTLLLKTGRRLYMDTRYETTYTLLDPDTTTYNYGDKGLIYFIANQDLEQNNTQYPDRPDLGICNYFEPSVVPDIPIGSSYAIISQSGDLVIDNSNYITLIPTFYNTDGTLNDSIVSSWAFIYPMTNKDSQFTITYSGNNCLIKVTEDYDLIGEKLICSVSDGNDGFVGSIDLIINA